MKITELLNLGENVIGITRKYLDFRILVVKYHQNYTEIFEFPDSCGKMPSELHGNTRISDLLGQIPSGYTWI